MNGRGLWGALRGVSSAPPHSRHWYALRGDCYAGVVPVRTPTVYLLVTVGAAGGAALLLWPRWLRPPPAATSASAAPRPPPRHAPPASDGGGLPAGVAGVAGPATTAVAAASPLCPAEMVYVEGNYCPFVAHRCERYVGGDPSPSGDFRRDRVRRCQRYRDTLLCEGRPSRLRYCIDRYEYPGIVGTKPAVMMSFRQARAACETEGKRLCYADEWAFACEGKRTLPYPYGLERDQTRCLVDRPSPIVDREALANPRDVSLEIQRLDRRVASGSQPQCRSPFEVFDTVGNVGEWVVDRQGDNHTAIAGGHWGKARATCRSLDSRHNASYRAHQVGFRCCRRARDGRSQRQLLPAGARLPKRRHILQQTP